MNKILLLSSAAILASGCMSGPRVPTKAEVSMQPTQGNTASGAVSFTKTGDKIRVYAEFKGLTPGAHGFHIHDKGDCSAPDGTSAGGHFNPLSKPHGNPDHADHHAGDLPMLVADANGNAKLTAYLSGITIGTGDTNIVGRGLIVHAAPDDFKTQPTGNSGARVACGVIAGTFADKE